MSFDRSAIETTCGCACIDVSSLVDAAARQVVRIRKYRRSRKRGRMEIAFNDLSAK
jgi:uncharacterized protein YfcZ (UPF0381/DUF406 family)